MFDASITFTATEASVRYAALGANSETFGCIEISGDGTIQRFSDPLPPRRELLVSLTIQGRPAAQVRAEATVWPEVFDEVTATDGIIGILWQAGTDLATGSELREIDRQRGDIFLEPQQFDRLASLVGPSRKISVTLFLKSSIQPGYDLVQRTDFNAVMDKDQL